MTINFAQLHNHSDFSLYDGFQKVEALVNRSAELGFPGVGLTDHGKVAGFIRLYKACLEQKKKHNRTIKPIFGSEFYLVSDVNDKKAKRHHLTVWAKNIAGYRNLLRLSTISHKNIVRNFPRIDIQILGEHREGLVVASGCVASKFSNLILEDKMDEATRMAQIYKSIFGDDYYVEIMWTNYEPQLKVLKHGCQIAKKNDIKIIITNDCHYTRKCDGEFQRAKVSISRNGPLSDGDYLDHQMYLKSYEEMQKVFDGRGEEYLRNTVEIVDKCDVELELGKAKLPSFEIPKNNDVFNEIFKKCNSQTPESEAYLRYLSELGLKRLNMWDKPGYRERLNKELETIKFTGFDTYFLIVQEYCEFARSQNIRLGAGRGCFCNTDFVELRSGYKPIDMVKVGDMVLSHDGKYHEVEETYSYKIDEEILKIEMKDGRKIHCTNDHEIYVSRNGEKTWVQAHDLLLIDNIVQVGDLYKRAGFHRGLIGKIKEKIMKPIRLYWHLFPDWIGLPVDDKIGFVYSKNCENYIKIKSIKTKQYNGKVHDLKVKNVHSYNIEGLAVHNSGVGSLVLYCLGVIGIDPIKYDLSMDRFLFASADYRTRTEDFFEGLQPGLVRKVEDTLAVIEDEKKEVPEDRMCGGECVMETKKEEEPKIKCSVVVSKPDGDFDPKEYDPIAYDIERKAWSDMSDDGFRVYAEKELITSYESGTYTERELRSLLKRVDQGEYAGPALESIKAMVRPPGGGRDLREFIRMISCGCRNEGQALVELLSHPHTLKELFNIPIDDFKVDVKPAGVDMDGHLIIKSIGLQQNTNRSFDSPDFKMRITGFDTVLDTDYDICMNIEMKTNDGRRNEYDSFKFSDLEKGVTQDSFLVLAQIDTFQDSKIISKIKEWRLYFSPINKYLVDNYGNNTKSYKAFAWEKPAIRVSTSNYHQYGDEYSHETWDNLEELGLLNRIKVDWEV